MRKNLVNTLAALLLTSVALPVGAATEGLKLEVLGDEHGLVRVERNERYLLLPIEDNAPEAQVRVLVNNRLEKTFSVRLAVHKVDYYVPFDLQDLKEGSVLLDVRTTGGRDQRCVEESVWSQSLKKSDTYDTTNREAYRPVYHHTPVYGWMNDPNGMFYKDGEWHLCYQYGPYGSTWNNMTWGHSVSRDLVNWEHLPNAIEPDGLGVIFSGSCVVDTANTAGFGRDAVVAIYTSVDKSQMQSLAYSTDDGRTFQSFNGNPIITSDKECRDPNMFWYEPTQRWIMVLAAAQTREMWIYSSADLKEWKKESAFGNGYGCQDGVWECPDLMQLPVRGTDEKKWVLICNINPGGPFGGSATQYFVGEFDGHQFVCDDAPEETKWMDFGKDHYAAVSWSDAPDNRHTVIAWMSNWQYASVVPTRQFRSANTLPRDLELFRNDDGELLLASIPSPEIEAARGKKVALGSFSAGTKGAFKRIPEACQGACEIELEFDGKKADKVQIDLINAKGDTVVMTYDLVQSTFAMDRSKSGVVDFHADFPAVTVAPCPKGSVQRLRLFVDRSSIEAFEGEGRFAMTNLVFPTEQYSSIRVKTDTGKCKVKALNIYPILINKPE